MTRQTHSGSQAGVSILEVLASVTVFAIVAAALTSTTVSTIKANNISRNATVAAFLIHDKVEELRSLDPVTAPAAFAAGLHHDAANPLTPLGTAGGRFTRTWQILPNTPAVGMAEVLIVVSWDTPDGPRSLRAATFVCRTENCT